MRGGFSIIICLVASENTILAFGVGDAVSSSSLLSSLSASVESGKYPYNISKSRV